MSEGVFAKQNSMLNFKPRSGDLQNNLGYGRWYKCETPGFRFPRLCMMENVIECEEAPEPLTEKTPVAKELACKGFARYQIIQ